MTTHGTIPTCGRARRLQKLQAPAFATLLSLTWSGSTFGQFTGHIGVRAITWRPGCGPPEEAVEAFNSDYLWYKVSVEVTIRNPTEHNTCPGGCFQPCTPAEPDPLPVGEQPCTTKFTRELVLSPCEVTGFCAYDQSKCMPDTTLTESAGCPNCDNREPGPDGTCVSICTDPAKRFCSIVTVMRAWVVASKAAAQDSWTTLETPEVICANGGEVPENTPACIIESVCGTGATAISRNLCEFDEWSYLGCVETRPGP